MPGIEIFPSIFQMTLLSSSVSAAAPVLAAAQWCSGAAPLHPGRSYRYSQMVGQGFGPAIVALCCGRNVPAVLRLHLESVPAIADSGATGRSMELRPPNIRYLSERLIILEFRASRWFGARRHLLLWPDSLSIRDNRRLRRYLESRRRLPLRSGMGWSTVSRASAQQFPDGRG